MGWADIIYQDFIAIGGMVSPGVCVITGAGTPRKWDERAGYGASGATLVYTGREISNFQAEFTIWDDSDLDDWDTFAQMLDKEVQSRSGQAWDIVHPILLQRGIKKVVIVDVGQLTKQDDNSWKAIIKFKEFRQRKQIVSKPDTATPDVPNAAPTAQDAADLQIQKLQAQIAAAS